MTGATARLNDITALELVPAVARWDGPIDPDFDGVLAACERMEPAAVDFGNAASDPPPRFDDTKPLTDQIYETWMRFASDCQAAARARDGDALKALAGELTDLGTLTDRLGRELPDDIECPERLRDEIQTCSAR
ncbi:MAG TPA: hypothetical protein VF230_18950 [Acidimicrobiales bacterium]